ncbi:M20/M25/M40 family metallo-hydrolase [Sphingomonas sp. SM33]|uniref:M20/M25/M40 family metallo-hydrolase n=1 Tax=Sphingomonas telluris TaxID=2907998 RepID=A0ABS9VRR3_9SPHN|nr:M20/M25/M40 family metallo-hydrolase [Sphingomonas telluris]MCH8617267.1 M20/M25/M40 family metallo-hydrolase [Sphingomonas telluris]
MSPRLLPAVAAAFALFATPAAAELSSAEQKMVQTVDAEQQRTVDMLATWVNQNSGSLNSPGVEAVGKMLRSELEPLGFKVDSIDMKAAGRAGHIVARHKGNGRDKRMLLIGHLDTVFEPDSPFQKWELKGDRGIGPGSGDDKGGMAVMIASLRAMKAAGTLKNADITVVLTGDEEDAGDPIEVTRAPLIEAGKWADVALDFEGLARKNEQDMGSTARRSSDSWTVTVTGNTGHSSTVMHPGYGAIYELARIIDTFRRELGEDKLTYNVGLIGGGASAELDAGRIRLNATGKSNIIAATAVARGDLRAISQDQIDRTKARMMTIVAQSLPGTKAQISFDKGGYPPMAPTEGNRAILARLNRINTDMGLPQMGELDPMDRGAGDISFVAKDVDGLVGLGPAGAGSHAPGESVDIPSISRQAKRAAILMSRLSKERR